ncbi:gliding motility-associated C-terminal domain-containing protein [Fulvivirgaceae bacterium PWU4]|uniref:Gliding motility-associated C-terminal domain-containing protein n=1 Tax=Chryseosolibacter histidini TaxID=2782349 RepID=A0AAP2DK59_9BACT|nr:PKD-like domain-containing protein [Chryseosolibacter histidini]MBT1697830.1 gliding motility-associated C-terminal domain-containing protein [Chryseosolibacter histidini]
MTPPAAVTSVPAGGSFKVTWSSDNSLTGLPLVSNSVTGTTPITLNLANQLTAAGFPTTALPGGVYTVLIEDNYSDCSYTQNFTVVDDVPNPFTISTADAALCEGEDFSMQIDNPSDPGVTYEVLDGTGPSAPVIATVMGTGGAVVVPPISGLSVGTHTIRVKASLSSCTPVFNDAPNITVVVTALPTVAASGATICSGDATNIAITTPNGLATSFDWIIQSNPGGVTGAVAGSGSTIAQTLTNPTTTAQTVTYRITPHSAACNGTPIDINVIVNPRPTILATPAAQTICSGDATAIALSNPNSVPGTTISWTVVQSGVTGATAGTGTSIAQTLTTTGAAQGTATYTVTATAGTCSSSVNVVVTVNPIPNVAASGATICSGDATNIAITSPNGLATSFDWIIQNNPGGVTGAVAGSGSTIAQTLTNPTNVAQTVTYRITPHTASCAGAPLDINVIVNPRPTILATPAAQTICSGDATAITLSNPNNVAGTTITWTVVQSGVTGATAGSGTSIAQTLTTTGAVQGTAAYTVTATAGTCSSSVNVIVTVNPLPNVAASGATICSGDATNIAITSPNGLATSFDWIIQNNPGGVTGAAAGSGSTIAQTLTNPTNTAQTVTYRITPHVGSCNGAPLDINVIVSPRPTILATPAAQTICSGDATAITLSNPNNVAGTTISWTVVQSGVTGATAGSGTSITQTLTTTAAVQGTATYTVTATAGSCSSTTTVIVTVNPLPDVAASGATICSGDATNIAITSPNGVATSFTWVIQNNPGGVTGAAAGTGNTIAQTLTNPTNTAQTVTYRITPHAGSCNGAFIDINVIVSPRPTVLATPAAQTICSGDATGITLSNPNNVAGTTISWTVVQSGVTGATAGSGTSIAQTLTTTGAAQGTATYTITATAGTCSSTTTVVVTVNPIPDVAASGATICSGDATNIAITSPNGVATSFTWIIQSNAGGVTGASAGTGNTIAQTLTNPTNTAQTVTYRITPHAAGCDGTFIDINVIVNPKPTVLAAPTAQSICSGDATAITLSNPNNVAGTTITWTVVQSGVTGATAGSGTSIAQTLTTTAAVPGTATYTVTATAGTCSSTTTVIVTVNPIPDVAASGATICSGDATNIAITSPNGAATSFTWIIQSNAGGVTGASAGTGNTIAQTLTNPTNTAQTVTYRITPHSATCDGTFIDINVIVNPKPTIQATPTAQTICSGGSTNITLSNPNNVAGTTITWTVVQSGVTGATAGSGTSIAQALTTTGAAQGTATYTVTATAGTCSSSTTVTVTVNPLPDVAASGATICSGDQTNIAITSPNGLATSFTWTIQSNPGGVTGAVAGSGNTIAQLLVNPTGTAQTVTYRITPHNATCNGAFIDINVIVNPTPTISAVPGAQTICSGANTGITLSNPNNVAGTTISWTVVQSGVTGAAAGSGASIVQALTTTGAAQGTATYTITATAGTCSRSTTVIVTVNPIPDVAASGATICSGTATNIAITSPNGAATSFTWIIQSNPGGVTGAAAGTGNTITQTLVNPTAVDQTVTYRITPHAAGCNGTPIDINVVVTPAPDAGADGAVTACNTETALDLFAELGGTPDAGGTWTDLDASGGVMTGDNIDLTGVTSGNSYRFRYTVTGTAPCANATAIVTVNVVNGTPDPGSNSTVSACNNITNLNLFTSLGGTPNGGGSWTDLDGSGATITGNHANLTTVTTAGAYRFRYTVTAGSCGTASAIVTVDVSLSPNAGTMGSLTQVCNSNTAFDLLAAMGGSPDNGGTWTDLDGSGAVITGNMANFTGVAEDSYAFRYSITVGSCTDMAILVVEVTDAPNAGTDDATSACNTVTALNLLAELGGTPDAGGAWTDLDASGGVLSGNNVNLTTVTPGTYRFRYTVTGTAPCANASAIVTVTVVNGTPDAGTDNTASACNNDTSFDLFGNLGGTPDPGGVWADDDGSGGTITGDNIDLTGVAAGTYDFTYTVTLAGCGTASATVTVTVTDAPDAGTGGGVATACSTQTALNLFNLLTGSPDTGGTWTDLDGSGAVITGNNANFTGVATGSYDFQYTVTGTGGCANATAIVTVNVTAAPDAGTPGGATVCNTETAFDLFSELGGTPDAGGAWADLDASGGVITGNAVNLTGVTTSGNYRFRYTVTGTGPCANATAIVTLNVIIGTPDPGTDNTVSACNTNTALNLFTSLGGTPDAGGTWSDDDGSGGVITGNTIDLTGVAAGTYDFTYTVTVTGCGTASATVTVQVTNPPDAGADNTADICSSETAFDLLAALNGTPDTGGTWADLDGSGAVITGNAANFSGVTTAGTYNFRYTVPGATGCADATADLAVTVTIAPDPGTPGNVTACVSATAFDLFGNLGGSPDTGGTWTDLDASGGVITGNSIDLSGVTPGTYRFRYTVTGTAPCANASAIVTINVINSTPDAGSNNSVTACNNDTDFDLFASLGGSPDPGGTWSDDDSSGGTITGDEIDLTGVTAGTYDFTYTITVAGCGTASATVTVAVSNAPDAGLDNTTARACGDDPSFDLFAALNGTPDTGGAWADLDGSGAVITGNVADFTGVAAGTYDFRYTVTGTGGCANATAVVTVTIGSKPVPTINTGSAACNGTNNGSITITGVTGGTAPYRYSINNGTSFQVGNSFTALAAGNYTVVVRDNNGCDSDPVPVTVTANVTIIPTIAKTDAACAGVDNGVITVTAVSGGVTPYQYSKDNGALFQTSNVFNSLQAGSNHTIVVRDANGCLSSVSSIIINAGTTISGTINKTDASSCAGTNGSITVTSPTGGVAPYQYSIDDGATFQGSGTFNPVSQGSYKVVIKDGNGCTSSAVTTNVGTVSGIVPVIAKVDAGCNGLSNGSITVTGVTGGLAPYMYSKDNGTTFQGGNSFTNLAAGSYAIIVRDAALCVSSVATISVNNGATISATINKTDASSCAGTNGSITITSPTGGTAPYDYSVDDGATFQGSGTFSPLTQGTYKVVIRDANGCLSSSTTVNIGTVSGIVPVIAKVDAGCNGLSNGSITVTGVTGGLAPYMYSKDNGATFQGGNSFTNLAAGNYAIIVRDAALCVSSVATISVNNGATISATINKTDASSCAGTNGSITITSPTGGTAPYDYSVDDGATFQGSGTFSPLAQGTYKVVIRDANGCLSSAVTINIGTVSGILPVIAKVDASCNGQTNGSITVTGVTGGLAPYTYSKDNGATFQGGNVFTNLASGNYAIIVRDASLCVSSVFTIAINNGITISASINKTDESCTGGDGVITITNPAGGATPYQFSINNGTSFQASGTFNNLALGVYSVVVRDNNGCTSSPATTAISKPSNCNGGGGTGLCSTVRIVPDPSPAQCTLSNGSIIFRIRPFVPAVNNTGVKISIVGTSTTNQTIARTQYNDSVFTALPIGTYAYAIEYGDVSCTKTGQVTIDQSGTVGTPLASNIIGPVCAGASTGTIILDVPGETGNILEWSLDAGITDPFKPFVAGGLVSGIPAGPAPTFERVISVRRNSADPCYASVRITIQDANPAINATFNITAATCSGNDGAITDIAASGGSGSGYQYSIDGGVNFQSGTSFTNLTGGAYILKVRDGLGCEKDINVNVTFPGFINATITQTNASCSNNATSGTITVTITDPGAFKVALSTDQFNEPADADYQNYQNPSVTFKDLSRNQYFIYMKSVAAACPTRSAPITISGAFALSFVAEPRCSGTDLSLALTDIVGDPGGAFEVWVYRKFTNVVVEKIQPGAIPATGSLFLSGADHSFLTTPDEYQLQMVQISPSAFCEIRSPLVDFTTPDRLYSPFAKTQESYPDIPTGTIQFTNFEGGTTAYDIRIELDSAASPALPFFETKWEEVTLNNDQRYEKIYRNLPPGRYIVQVVDSFGCSIENIARVKLDKNIFVPNIFTPNDDDINDVFFIRNLPQDDNTPVKLVITSRWGKSVYTTDKYKNNWKGEGAVDGVYFYQLKVGNAEPLNGWVEILRGQKP